MNPKSQFLGLGIVAFVYACVLWHIEKRLMGDGYEPLDFDLLDQVQVVSLLGAVSLGPPLLATLATNAALNPFWCRAIVPLGHSLAVVLTLLVCLREQSAPPSFLGSNLFTHRQWSSYFSELKFLGQAFWLIMAQLALCLVLYAIRNWDALRRRVG